MITSCPGAFLAADGGGASIPANQTEETFLQVAPLLGETYTILLGEVEKFVPFSPVRFKTLVADSAGGYKLGFAGKAGEVVTVVCAQGESGLVKRIKGTVGAGGIGSVMITPNTMWL